MIKLAVPVLLLAIAVGLLARLAWSHVKLRREMRMLRRERVETAHLHNLLVDDLVLLQNDPECTRAIHGQAELMLTRMRAGSIVPTRKDK